MFHCLRTVVKLVWGTILQCLAKRSVHHPHVCIMQFRVFVGKFFQQHFMMLRNFFRGPFWFVTKHRVFFTVVSGIYIRGSLCACACLTADKNPKRNPNIFLINVEGSCGKLSSIRARSHCGDLQSTYIYYTKFKKKWRINKSNKLLIKCFKTRGRRRLSRETSRN